ncbi:twin-arginine translocation signal domain-containing protein, partial [Methanosarcina mazei]
MSTGMKNLTRTLDSMDFLKMDRRTFMKAVSALGATAFLGTY